MSTTDRPGERGGGRIEIFVEKLDQLFHLLDPSPFYVRKLDGDAEEYIVSHARELPHDVPWSLAIHLAEPAPTDPDRTRVADAVHAHFRRRAEGCRRELRQLFRRGRVALAVGLPFLAFSIVAGEMVRSRAPRPLTTVLLESLLVGGWVAMWRPLEIFLYDWWPIRDRRRVFERLAGMEVGIMQQETDRERNDATDSLRD